MAEPAAPPPGRIALGGALVVLALVAYLPALANGWVWDDDDHVTRNETLRSPAGLARIWAEPGATPQYYPLVFTTFWIEYHVWGLDPAGYHVANVLLHGVNAWLAWLILRRLGVGWAWVAAAVFAVHPVHVESVAWVAERKNVLSGLFYLAAFWSYLKFVETDRRAWYVAATGLFLAALLSKTVTATLPAMLVLVLWWQDGRVTRRDLLWLAPWFALGIGFGAWTVHMETTYGKASGPDFDLSFTQRTLIAGNALAFYAGKLVCPWPLLFIYHRWHVNPADPAWYVAPAAVVLVVAGLWLARGRIGRGPVTAVLGFAGTLFPALGFFDVYPFRYSFVADHFQYLASIPLIALAAAGAGRLLGGRPVAPAVVGAVLVILAALTARRTLAYADEQTLWEDTLAKYPDCAVAHARLGLLMASRGQFRPAADHYREVVRLTPDSVGDRLVYAGVAAQAGRTEEAEAAFRAVLAADPGSTDARVGLADTLTRAHRYAEAAAEIEAVLAGRPADAHLHYLLGTVRARQGRTDLAVREVEEAHRLAPDNPEYARALDGLRPLAKP